MDYGFIALVVIAVLFVLSGIVTVQQGYISVITMFGKYRRIMRPGLNIKIPFLEKVYTRVSIQNRSVELEFQAVTIRSGQRVLQIDAAVQCDE
nr:SPFH domain-containing protein [Phnomibacter ginsenosidimutans]